MNLYRKNYGFLLGGLLATSNIDISIVGKILLSEFEELNPAKFKLVVVFSMLNGKSCRIFNLNGRVRKLFKNKKGHTALFKLRIDEAINELIATRVLLRFGKDYNSLKLCGNYLDIFNKLKSDIDKGVAMEANSDNDIHLVDSFTKNKIDYLPQDKISNPDEIIWFLKNILVNIRQRAGSACKDCSYFGCLAEFAFEYIDPAQLNSHVDFNEESFNRLAQKLKSLQIKAGDEAYLKTERNKKRIS